MASSFMFFTNLFLNKGPLVNRFWNEKRHCNGLGGGGGEGGGVERVTFLN